MPPPRKASRGANGLVTDPVPPAAPDNCAVLRPSCLHGKFPAPSLFYSDGTGVHCRSGLAPDIIFLHWQGQLEAQKRETTARGKNARHNAAYSKLPVRPVTVAQSRRCQNTLGCIVAKRLVIHNYRHAAGSCSNNAARCQGQGSFMATLSFAVAPHVPRTVIAISIYIAPCSNGRQHGQAGK
jgi:hypothetical protein